ncbi:MULTISPECIES: DUF3008 family protein [Burkholderia]|nr:MULTISPECIES: DUF3008 family protein [Burkholderia]
MTMDRASPSRARAADRRVDACAHDRRAITPATSRAWKSAARAVLSARCGNTKMRDLMPPAMPIARSMSEREREKMASKPTRGKPEHKHDA